MRLVSPFIIIVVIIAITTPLELLTDGVTDLSGCAAAV